MRMLQPAVGDAAIERGFGALLVKARQASGRKRRLDPGFPVAFGGTSTKVHHTRGVSRLFVT